MIVMRAMIKHIVLWLPVVLFLNMPSWANKTVVEVLADDSYPPYSYLENNNLKGIYIDIVKTISKDMQNFEIKIKPTPWKRALSEIENGTSFAILPPYYHIEKRPYIWPYSLPILDERVAVFCNEKVFDNSIRKNWPEDYVGLKIGNNSGFQLGGDAFWQAVKDGKIFLSETKSTQSNILRMALGRIDCYMNDRLSIKLEIQKLIKDGQYQPGTNHVSFLEGATISLEQGFLGITDKDDGKFSYKTQFIKEFNFKLHQLRKTGQLQKIMDNFIANFGA